ncbi:MAG: SpoIIIAC/SpoIIIAD family protein [Clostridia bacterium]|jgi:stage III sporulation protein AD|nr:stage III sporulation protein AD [Clostridia bacterium]MDD4275412.1 SpoIIIAC/SpoIIIAD family protein [Clostridia bacterium]
MEIIKIIGVGIVTSICVLVVKQIKPEIAVVLGIAGSLVILVMVINMLSDVFNVFNIIVDKTGVSKDLFTAILKIIGVGYITEFGANVCLDSGSANIADKVLLGGKIVIMVLALPIITSLIEIIESILP